MAMQGRIVEFPEHRSAGALEPWVDELAVRHFSVSERTVRRWREDGMPSRLFGGLRRYRLGECERWHEGRSV